MVLISSWRVEFSSLRVPFLKYFYACRVSLFLIGILVSNRFANYAITGVYMDFLTGKWNTPIYAAAMVINLKEALTSLFSIVGATYATHAEFGRYHAIRLSLLPFTTGLGLFAFAAANKVPRGPSIALFCASLLLTTAGEGMQKHTLFDFGYDQFKCQMEDEKKAKLQAHIWWNAGRLVGTVGGLVASTLLNYHGPKSMQNNWWVFGGIVSCGLTAVTSIIYNLGKLSFYKTRIRVKSHIIDVLKVVVAAVRKRHLPYPTHPCLIYEEGRNPATTGNATQEAIQTTEGTEITIKEKNQDERQGLAGDHTPAAHSKLRFLQKASIIESPAQIDTHESQWRLCSSTKVKNAELVLRLLPLWSTFLMFQVVNAMGDTFFLEQGNAMLGKISVAILLAVQNGSQLLIVQLLKKVARLKHGIPDPLVRIGIGLFISIVCCTVAGVVELQRLHNVVPDELGADPRVSEAKMSIFWLVPQCFLLGTAVGFAEDGISDFFDTRVPQELRVCYRLTSESVKGVGCLLNSLILAAIHLFSRLGPGHHWIGDDINTGMLHIVYFMIAGISTMNLFFFYISSRNHNQLPIISADHERPKEDQSKLPTRQDDEKDEPIPEEDGLKNNKKKEIDCGCCFDVVTSACDGYNN